MNPTDAKFLSINTGRQRQLEVVQEVGNEGSGPPGRHWPRTVRESEDQPTIASATASATRMPSMAADMMPPA